MNSKYRGAGKDYHTNEVQRLLHRLVSLGALKENVSFLDRGGLSTSYSLGENASTFSFTILA